MQGNQKLPSVSKYLREIEKISKNRFRLLKKGPRVFFPHKRGSKSFRAVPLRAGCFWVCDHLIELTGPRGSCCRPSSSPSTVSSGRTSSTPTREATSSTPTREATEDFGGFLMDPGWLHTFWRTLLKTLKNPDNSCLENCLFVMSSSFLSYHFVTYIYNTAC